MPVKFGKTSSNYDRATGKTTLVHDYMKCKSNAELIEAYNKDCLLYTSPSPRDVEESRFPGSA